MSGYAYEEDWRREAECAGSEVDLWFPDRGDFNAIQQAKSFCHRCPVRIPCLEDSLATGDVDFGVRGGLSARERQRLQRTMTRKPPGWKVSTPSKPCKRCGRDFIPNRDRQFVCGLVDCKAAFDPSWGMWNHSDSRKRRMA